MEKIKETLKLLAGLPFSKKLELARSIVINNSHEAEFCFGELLDENLANDAYGYWIGNLREKYPMTVGEIIQEIDFEADGDNDLEINKRLDLEELMGYDRLGQIAFYQSEVDRGNWYYSGMDSAPSKFMKI